MENELEDMKFLVLKNAKDLEFDNDLTTIKSLHNLVVAQTKDAILYIPKNDLTVSLKWKNIICHFPFIFFGLDKLDCRMVVFKDKQTMKAFLEFTSLKQYISYRNRASALSVFSNSVKTFRMLGNMGYYLTWFSKSPDIELSGVHFSRSIVGDSPFSKSIREFKKEELPTLSLTLLRNEGII